MEESTVLFNGRWLRLRARGGWEYAERTNPGGASIIVAATPDGQTLMVEQYRKPIQQRTLEFPAGLIGDSAEFEGEAALDSARRELLEETGWHAARMEALMGGPSSAGMSTEVMHFVRASQLTRQHAGGGLEGENITVHLVPIAHVAQFVLAAMQRGFAIDPKVYAGIWFLSHQIDGTPLPDGWYR